VTIVQGGMVSCARVVRYLYCFSPRPRGPPSYALLVYCVRVRACMLACA
jgi:hypothetical protein